MFQERKGDQERAEMFALGLLKDEFSELTLVPCRNKVFCRTHGTFWIRKKFWIRGINPKQKLLYLMRRK
jgi:hypothetical protein